MAQRSAVSLVSMTAISSVLLLALSLVSPPPARAQTHADILAAAAASCAVMAGTQRADSRTLQYLLLMDEDMGDANPVATALYRQVVSECPKAYLSYEQRKRSHNPFPPGSLTPGGTTQLVGSGTPLTAKPPQDYAVRCHGASGMATSSGTDVAVSFTRAPGPAVAGLAPGRCGWLDRGFRAGEPAKIVVRLPSADVARRVAVDVNAGQTWTFWVFVEGTHLRADSLAQGTPAHKRS